MKSTCFANGSSSWGQMEGNAMCLKYPMQSLTAVQYQGDVKNSRAGPEQLTAGMRNEEHTSASPTSQRGSLCTVTSADETGLGPRLGLRTPCRSCSGFPPLNSTISYINCLLRRRCLCSHTSRSPTVRCLQSRKCVCGDTWRISPAGDETYRDTRRNQHNGKTKGRNT